MNDPQERLMELFHEGCARPAGAEREAFLAAACGADATLLEQVTRLIEAHAQAGDFLQEPVALPPAGAGDDNIGAVIGRYHLLEEIGEGGFGRVFRAEQTEPVHRCVALKVIKAGMDTREVIARFEAERQALALMDHPHIAKVLDAGATETGRPYFVMELVDGLPITRFCDQHRLATADRLALFIKVCHAVQHAHQKGVIHRDLKPTNILVAEVDGQPEPKIIDFGVAKALGPKLTERTLFTAAQQVIGTPGYMSPEQADPQDGDIDTRCDIYSLGVLLYELLTGVTPFDTAGLHLAAVDEIRRIIRETDPPKPSTRLRELGVQLGVVAQHRRTDPAALTRSVHGDLDWIVMKALEKDRARRYQTISALAEDLHHHLANEPVAAGPPGRLYRIGKFIRRHRFGSGMAAAAVVAVLASLAALAFGLHQAKQERDRAVAAEGRAEAEAKRAEVEAVKAAAEAATSTAINEFLLKDLLGQASPEEQPDREVKLRTLVNRAAAKVGERFNGRPLIELTIRSTLWDVYSNLGEFEKAQVQIDRMKEIAHLLRLPNEDPRWLRLRHAEACLLVGQGRASEAQKLLEDILTVRRRTLGEEHPDTLLTILDLAVVHRSQGRLDEASALYEQILPVQRRTLGEEHLNTLYASINLVIVYMEQDRLEESRKLCEKILPVLRRILGEEHPVTLSTIHNFAGIHHRQGLSDEARKLFEEILSVRRRSLGDEHPDTLKTLASLAGVHMDQGSLDEARKIYEQVLPVSRRTLGEEHPDTLLTIHALASVHLGQGRLGEARKLFEQILPVQRRTLGGEHPNTLSTIHNLALVNEMQGRLEEACKLYELVLPLRRQTLGEDHPRALVTALNLAIVYVNQGRLDEARTLCEQILPLQHRKLGEEHRQTLSTIYHLARIHSAQGRVDKARKLIEQILPVQRRTLGEEHPDTLLTIEALAAVHMDQGRLDEARKLYEEILPVRRRILGEEHSNTLSTIHNLAVVCGALGRQDEALGLYEEILPVRRRVQGDTHPDTVRAMRNMAQIYQQQGRADEMARIYGILSAVDARSPGPDEGERFATVQILASLASSLGDWPQAAEHWRRRIALSDDSFEAHRNAAIAALMAGDTDGYAKECNAMLAWVARGAKGGDGEVAAETSLAAPHPAIDLAACARLAERALQRKPNGNWTRLVKGMAEYRAGDIEAAHRRFQAFVGDREASVALTARCFLALSHHRLGNDEAAKEALAGANRSLDPILRRGLSLGGEPGWGNTAAALAVRAEAERAVFGKELSPKVDMASLAAARAAWRPVKDALRAGKTAALAGEWQEAAAAFDKALAEPDFDWSLAQVEASGIWNWLGVVFARAGDPACHLAVCRRMAGAIEEFPDPKFEALRVAKPLVLRAGSPAELLERARELLLRSDPDPEARTRPDWTGLHWALLEYRSADYPAALESAAAAATHSVPCCRAAATAVQAMAAKRLGRDGEFDQLIQRVTLMRPELEKEMGNQWRVTECLIVDYLLDEAEHLDP